MLGVQPATRGISRRRFLGYLIAAPTLVAAAELGVQPAPRRSRRSSRSTSTT